MARETGQVAANARRRVRFGPFALLSVDLHRRTPAMPSLAFVPRLLLAVLPALVATSGHAATFCVETSAQLHNALAIAGSNNQDDSILLTAGNFTHATGFTLSLVDGHGLQIDGGWQPFLGNPCAFAVPDPWLTRIDGHGQQRGLTVELIDHGYLYIRQLTIENGVAGSGHGGGIEVSAVPGNPGNVLLERMVFINNSAAGDGGALMLAGAGTNTLTNNLFINNSAGGQAGAARLIGPGAVRMIGNTVAYNRAFGAGAIDGVYLAGSGGVLANNLLWANGGGDGRDLLLGGTGFVLRHNNYGSLWGQPPAAGSAANLSVDPLFRGGCGNVRLDALSPVVDAGTVPGPGDDWVLPPYDLDGNSRIGSGDQDLGAFELETLFRDGFEGPSPCPAPL